MFVISVLAAAISAGTAILYACLGEILCERAGVLNLGVEGMMLMGALGGFAVNYWTHDPWLGVLAAMLAGGLMSLIHAVLTITLRANQVVSGLALTIFGSGLAAFLGQPLVGQPAPAAFVTTPIPVLADIPALGPIFFQQDMLTYGLYVLVPLLWWYMFRTRPGLYLRAVGENPATTDAMGLSVARLRYLYVVLGGVLAGVGGATISLATNPSWVEGITAGRGWIAVALVIFATWNPLRAALGAYLFGGIEAIQFRLQSAGTPISPFFLNMLPYLFTVLVLVLATRETVRRRASAPAALGNAYVREER
ncbi:MAG TPA: ABC transporter permease [Roseiflexaceae bacterium]|jgi:simple sugar transport system permease protein|nr:ABC transporter permease [Roseiflexaceae bacterium]